MADNKYSALLSEGFNVGGKSFRRNYRAEGDNIVARLQEILEESMILSNHHDATPFAKSTKWCPVNKSKLVDEIDYRGNVGRVKFDMHNATCINIRGSWGGLAQSKSHVSPGASFEITFICTKGATDVDMAALVNHLHKIGYNISWDGRKPSDILWSSGILGHGRKATGPDPKAVFLIEPDAHRWC